MFGPKHKAADVALMLEQGLLDGSIVLDEADLEGDTKPSTMDDWNSAVALGAKMIVVKPTTDYSQYGHAVYPKPGNRDRFDDLIGDVVDSATQITPEQREQLAQAIEHAVRNSAIAGNDLAARLAAKKRARSLTSDPIAENLKAKGKANND